MTPEEVKAARNELGMTQAEYGRALRLSGDKANRARTVRQWETPIGEKSHRRISGPAIVATEALLSGWRPDFWKRNNCAQKSK